MKTIAVILSIILCPTINACALTGNQHRLKVTVIDLKTGNPVEKAVVYLYFVKPDNVNVFNDSALTDKKGRCTIPYEFYDHSGYNLLTRKAGLYPCYSIDTESKEISGRSFNPDKEKAVTLYLTSDVKHLLNYYSSFTPHYQIDTLIHLLKTNTYNPSNRGCLPELNWKDIPKLLSIGNDDSRITNFTVNVLSSYAQNDCRLGIFALWLIESIRISEGKQVISPQERFPSPDPVLRKKSASATVDTPEITDETAVLNLAYKAYLSWWDHVKAMDPEDACRINPLVNSGLYW
jgi:hypothetical protein